MDQSGLFSRVESQTHTKAVAWVARRLEVYSHSRDARIKVALAVQLSLLLESHRSRGRVVRSRLEPRIRLIWDLGARKDLLAREVSDRVLLQQIMPVDFRVSIFFIQVII